MRSETSAPLILGIDTGGTFTDAVVLNADTTSVLATIKIPTTHRDLVAGVETAIGAVLSAGSANQDVVDPADIGLVSVSTTLATNALVEGHGEPACLVVAGFGETELERLQTRLVEAGLGPADALLVPVAGGHDALGREAAPIDETELAQVAARTASRVTAYAIATQFSVRNPAHELAIARLLTTTGHPATCSHELSARLDGPRRALTALLNARLVKMIARLEAAVRVALRRAGINAPLMMVRGDGSLVSAELLARRPIETILSGPAASVVGAQHLAATALGSVAPPDRVIVVDIGGTTTDIATIEDGRPRITADGARVAGHHTMVEAIDLATFGLGGDSEVQADTGDEPFRLGPARAIPLSRLAVSDPGIVADLTEQLASPTTHGQGRLLVQVSGVTAGDVVDELDERHRHLLTALDDGPQPETAMVAGKRDAGALRQLRRSGALRVVTFTPTDAAVVLGWLEAAPAEREAAALGAELLARRSDRRGSALASSASDLARRVVDELVARSADLVVDCARRADHLDLHPTDRFPGTVESPDRAALADERLLRAGLGHHRGFLAVDVELGAVLVAVGAAADAYYPNVADRLGARLVTPEHGAVANAVGAAVGSVRMEAQLTIVRPRAGRFEIQGTVGDVGDGCSYRSLDEARAAALDALTSEVVRLAVDAGADPGSVMVTDTCDAATATVGGRELLVEATLRVVATGRPRFS